MQLKFVIALTVVTVLALSFTETSAKKKKTKTLVVPDYLISEDKPTRQSSTIYNGRSSRAIDFDKELTNLGYTCAMTNYQKNPWWYVDLLYLYKVAYLKVKSSTIFGDNLKNFAVYGGKTLKKMKKCAFHKGVVKSNKKFTKIVCKTKARYIKIQIKGKGHLTLCEVDVFGKRADGREETMLLSEKKKAYQSSVTFHGVASRAVDGNADRIFSAKSCTRTRREKAPWWMVDLGQNYDLESVVIYNRAHFGHRLKRFDVLTKYDDGKGKKSEEKFHVCASRRRQIENGEAVTLVCEERARYVKIQLRDYGILSLCEVRVYGYSIKALKKPKKKSSLKKKVKKAAKKVGGIIAG